MDITRWQVEVLDWKRDKKRSENPPQKPERPPSVRFILSDTTIEALAPILLENPRGVLLARDELSGWIGSFDAYKSGRGADAAHWLSCHVGESIIVDRKTGEPKTIYVPNAAVSVCGGIQPRVLDRVIGSEHRENGLLARLLLAHPPRLRKRWFEAVISRGVSEAFCGIFERLYDLKLNVSDEGKVSPDLVPLSSDGKKAWVEFYNEHGRDQAELVGDLAAAAAKLEAYAARFALVVHLVRREAEDPSLDDPNAIDEASVSAGVALARWFGNEARRVYGMFAESEEDRDRRRLVEWIAGRGGSVTVRDLTHRMREYRDKAEDAKAALEDLVKAEFGVWRDPAPGPKGGRPSTRFELISPVAVTETPPGDNSAGRFGSGDGQWGEL